MWIESILARNLVPDCLIRSGIRRRLRKKILQESSGGPEVIQARLSHFIRELRESPIAILTTDANEQHYEVPAEFFRIVLGDYLKYSCGLWTGKGISLADSEKAMLELYCSRARLAGGLDILDLGCGWGSLSLYTAEKYPDSRVTAVSNSRSQKEYIDARCREKGIQNLQVITCDINHLRLEKQYDRVLSIEMFEHMRNYEKLLSAVSGWLKPDGLLFVHIFTHKSFAYPYETEDPNAWMARYFFSGGIMPSRDLLLHFQDDVRLIDQWSVDGRHYQATCEAWLKKMDAAKAPVLDLFRTTYGKEDALRWFVWWRIFFMACAELFGYEKGRQWFVSHYLFENRKA